MFFSLKKKKIDFNSKSFYFFIVSNTFNKQATTTTTEIPACGDCYGAKLNETHCCNTCQDVIDAYREKRWNPEPEKFEQCKRENYVDKEGEAKKLALTEGCEFYGHIEVNRVRIFKHFTI